MRQEDLKKRLSYISLATRERGAGTGFRIIFIQIRDNICDSWETPMDCIGSQLDAPLCYKHKMRLADKTGSTSRYAHVKLLWGFGYQMPNDVRVKFIRWG